MRLFLHDLPEKVASAMFPDADDTTVIGEEGPVLFCTGCRKCEYAPDGVCALKDGYENMAKKLSSCETLCIVSRLTYGGFSPFVKSVLDRSRGYHAGDEEKGFDMRILFYSDTLLPWEEMTAREMAENLRSKFGALRLEIEFTEPVWEES